MQILIVLCITLLCIFLGGFVGGALTDDSNYTETPRTGNIEQDMANAYKSFGQGADIAARTQTNVMIGAGVGVLVGIGAGIALASKLRRKRQVLT